MTILAIDPGYEQTAFVAYNHNDERIENMGIVPNGDFLLMLPALAAERALACEMVACYGMAVGREVFETCVWIGRFIQAAHPQPIQRVYRRDVKMHLCGSNRATDANIHAAIADLFGGRRCKGIKAAPGPLYGVKSDLWAALGVAITASGKLPVKYAHCAVI
jgi:hypothetical protein